MTHDEKIKIMDNKTVKKKKKKKKKNRAKLSSKQFRLADC